MLIIDSLSAFFVIMYNKNNSALNFIAESFVPNYAMVTTYRHFINETSITPIENLMIEEKIQLWEECKSHGINKNKIVDAAKILHTIKFINENS